MTDQNILSQADWNRILDEEINDLIPIPLYATEEEIEEAREKSDRFWDACIMYQPLNNQIYSDDLRGAIGRFYKEWKKGQAND